MTVPVTGSITTASAYSTIFRTARLPRSLCAAAGLVRWVRAASAGRAAPAPSSVADTTASACQRALQRMLVAKGCLKTRASQPPPAPRPSPKHDPLSRGSGQDCRAALRADLEPIRRPVQRVGRRGNLERGAARLRRRPREAAREFVGRDHAPHVVVVGVMRHRSSRRSPAAASSSASCAVCVTSSAGARARPRPRRCDRRGDRRFPSSWHRKSGTPECRLAHVPNRREHRVDADVPGRVAVLHHHRDAVKSGHPRVGHDLTGASRGGTR